MDSWHWDVKWYIVSVQFTVRYRKGAVQYRKGAVFRPVAEVLIQSKELLSHHLLGV